MHSAAVRSEEIGLLFFAGLHDRRACLAPQGVGLSAGLDGWVAAGPAGIWWWKDPSLADELELVYQRWRGPRPARAGGLSAVPRAGGRQCRPAARWLADRAAGLPRNYPAGHVITDRRP